MRLDRLVKLEKRLASWFDRSLRDPGGSPDPIELVPMILDHVEEHVQPTADGGRAFPYDRVTIQVRVGKQRLEAFRAVFSFQQPLEALNPADVSNLDKAIANAEGFAAEVIAWLRKEKGPLASAAEKVA